MSTYGLVSLLALAAFVGLAGWAAYCDLRNFTIPNRISLAIAALYPAYALAAPHAVNWTGAITVAALVLLAGFLLFSRGMIGGGDAKLLAAISLWAGPTLFLPFLLYTAVVGGLLCAIYWVGARRAVSAAGELSTTKGFIDWLRVGMDRPVPYAVAIGIGAVYVAFTLYGLR